jgi:hypothetical protein
LIVRLGAFYQIHNPAKLQDGSLEQIGEAFEDREDALNQALANQYGVDLTSVA